MIWRFYEGVKDLPNVAVYGNFNGEREAIVALNIGYYESGMVSDVLSEDYGIATRPGHIVHPECTMPLAQNNRVLFGLVSRSSTRKK